MALQKATGSNPIAKSSRVGMLQLLGDDQVIRQIVLAEPLRTTTRCGRDVVGNCVAVVTDANGLGMSDK